MHLKNAWCTFVVHFPLPWLFGYYWLGGFRCNNQQVHNWERNSFFIFRVILEMCTKRNAFYFSYCRFICNIQTHTKLKDYHLFWDIIIYWHFRNVSINTHHTHTHTIFIHRYSITASNTDIFCHIYASPSGSLLFTLNSSHDPFVFCFLIYFCNRPSPTKQTKEGTTGCLPKGKGAGGKREGGSERTCDGGRRGRVEKKSR